MASRKTLHGKTVVSVWWVWFEIQACTCVASLNQFKSCQNGPFSIIHASFMHVPCSSFSVNNLNTLPQLFIFLLQKLCSGLLLHHSSCITPLSALLCSLFKHTLEWHVQQRLTTLHSSAPQTAGAPPSNNSGEFVQNIYSFVLSISYPLDF